MPKLLPTLKRFHPLKDELSETSVSMIRHKNKWISTTLAEVMARARKAISPV